MKSLICRSISWLFSVSAGPHWEFHLGRVGVWDGTRIMFNSLASLLFVLLLVLSGCGFSYQYSKPGVSRQQSAQDHFECKQISRQPYIVGTGGMLLGGSEPTWDVLKECLEARGYSVTEVIEETPEQAQAASERVIRFHQEERARETRENAQLKLESEHREGERLARESAEQVQRDRAQRMVEQMKQKDMLGTNGINGKDGALMMVVPEGEFLYGEDNQRMTLPAFYMDLYEVTTSRYAAFMQATRHSQPRYWEDVRSATDGDLPVVGVEWDDAGAFCRHYGKRLPTEQEWEKAARGTDGRKYPWGNTAPTPVLANYRGGLCGPFCNVYREKLKPVNSYKDGRSPYGMYNMAGNAYEWVEEKVVRGGSVNSVNYSQLLSTHRWWFTVQLFFQLELGFRCAQDAG